MYIFINQGRDDVFPLESAQPVAHLLSTSQSNIFWGFVVNFWAMPIFPLAYRIPLFQLYESPKDLATFGVFLLGGGV